MSDMRVNQLLDQMRLMSLQAQGLNIQNSTTPVDGFSSHLKLALAQVNQTMQDASAMKIAYDQGDSTVSLSDVMVSSQKSNLAFESVLQIKNRFIQAYREIMEMPV